PLLAHAGVRTAMKANEDAEPTHRYGYRRGLPPADELPAAGYGVGQVVPAQAPRISRLFSGTATGSARVAVATDARRAVLEEVAVNVARDTYLRRWDRAHAAGWLGTKPPAVPTPPVPAPDTASADSSQRTVQRLDQMDLAGAAEKAKARRRELE